MGGDITIYDVFQPTESATRKSAWQTGGEILHTSMMRSPTDPKERYTNFIEKISSNVISVRSWRYLMEYTQRVTL
jgi:hypothetical protein